LRQSIQQVRYAAPRTAVDESGASVIENQVTRVVARTDVVGVDRVNSICGHDISAECKGPGGRSSPLLAFRVVTFLREPRCVPRCGKTRVLPGVILGKFLDVLVGELRHESTHYRVLASAVAIVSECTLQIVSVLASERRILRRDTDALGTVTSDAKLLGLLRWLADRFCARLQGFPGQERADVLHVLVTERRSLGMHGAV